MAEDSKKTYALSGEQYRDLMGRLEFTFVSSATSNKNRDGSYNGTITRYQEEVAQIKVYLNEFNSENTDRVIIATDYPAIRDTLREMKIRPERNPHQMQKKDVPAIKLGRK